jgi:energy-converting hydrogenase Eha subunit B
MPPVLNFALVLYELFNAIDVIFESLQRLELIQCQVGVGLARYLDESVVCHRQAVELITGVLSGLLCCGQDASADTCLALGQDVLGRLEVPLIDHLLLPGGTEVSGEQVDQWLGQGSLHVLLLLG